MDCVQSKARMNVEGDRLSMLPDDLIHKILSFISTKRAVQTSALSSRWRFLWTSLPYLYILFDEFDTSTKISRNKISEFLNSLLSGRNTQMEVYSVNLSWHEKITELWLKQILDYAFSHNVQQLTVTCLVEEDICFPLHLFHSSSLKYLRLTGCNVGYGEPYHLHLRHSSTWDLPALTTLHLEYVEFHEGDLFSMCANLKSLTLYRFEILDPPSYTLCHPRLSSLTLKYGIWASGAVNVVAPQLENLSIISCFEEILITAPSLISLLFKYEYSACCRLQFSTDLPSLEKVDLCISSTNEWSGCRVAALLQQLNSVKSLTLNLEFLKPLISYMERISLQPPPFSNLECLKIYPVHVPSDDEAHKKVIMSSKVLNYFVDGSLNATITLISYEETKEIRQKAQAIANAAEAQNLMENLQVLLEKEKTNIENNNTCMTAIESNKEDDRDEEEENETDDQIKAKAPVERVQLQLKRKMAQMKRCWEDVGVRIDQGKIDTREIISKLRDIEVALLKDLPASKRDELQAYFSSLCVEVNTVVKKIFQHMMTPHIDLSDCINELATVPLLSS